MHIEQVTLDLRLQASTPSTQVCCTPFFLAPPQLWYHAPPGAQQLTRPDFLNLPHFGHIAIVEATSDDVEIAMFERANHR